MINHSQANRIWDLANDAAQLIQAAGFEVSAVDKSINRNGDYSAYFTIRGHMEVRVSDHSTNRMHGSSGLFYINPNSGEEVAQDAIEYLGSNEYRQARERARDRREAQEAKWAAEKRAEAERLAAIHAEEAKWIEMKAAFIRENDLENATKTAREKAWREYKKALKA